MCKIVYLTCNRFNKEARKFRNDLAFELEKRNIEVVKGYSYDIFNFWRKHKTYGISLAFDFYQNGKSGAGLTLNKNCSYIARDFAYNLCNDLDKLTPNIAWRDFKFVSSGDKEWYKSFNKVSSTTKAIFYLCTQNNEVELDLFTSFRDHIIRVFVDEILRCLRSNYDSENYRKRVAAAQLKLRKIKE